MKFNFVFVHGWGVDSGFWNDLINCLPEIKASRIDLGFIGTRQDFLDQISSSAIYVTHSLGTMWVLKNHNPGMEGLIAINGFGCFRNFAEERVLRAMKVRLKREPEAQMKEFWDMCGLPVSSNLNVERLQEGLEWLTSWDAGQALKDLKCPVLALAGHDDPILPIAKMEKEWDNFDLHICEGGAHALPLSDPGWCSDHIKAFCNAF